MSSESPHLVPQKLDHSGEYKCANNVTQIFFYFDTKFKPYLK